LGFTMQSLFNVMSVASFVMSAGMMIGTVTIYSRIPALTKRYVSELKLELTEMITDMVPGQIDEVMPELPTQTGPAMPIKSPF
jgi:F0F1-type ATP synthase membrane subunit a